MSPNSSALLFVLFVAALISVTLAAQVIQRADLEPETAEIHTSVESLNASSRLNTHVANYGRVRIKLCLARRRNAPALPSGGLSKQTSVERHIACSRRNTLEANPHAQRCVSARWLSRRAAAPQPATKRQQLSSLADVANRIRHRFIAKAEASRTFCLFANLRERQRTINLSNRLEGSHQRTQADQMKYHEPHWSVSEFFLKEKPPP